MKKILTNSNRTQYHKLENVIGCKWSVSVLMAVGEGVTRPGALERHISGISTKVLSERLRKLTDYALLNKKTFPQTPPRTEYSLTKAGCSLIEIIQQVHELDEQIKHETAADINDSELDADSARKKVW